MKNTLAAILVVSAAAIAAPASAGDDMSFRYKAHELETMGGTKALYKRLSRAVKGACTTNGRKSLTTRANEKTCMNEMKEHMIHEIDHPRLHLVHNQTNERIRVARNRD